MDGGVAVPLPGGLCFASDLKLDSHLCDEDARLCMYVRIPSSCSPGKSRGGG